LLAEPQEPLIERLAEQLAVVPLFKPVHSQVQGPLPETEVLFPAEQRLVEGAE